MGRWPFHRRDGGDDPGPTETGGPAGPVDIPAGEWRTLPTVQASFEPMGLTLGSRPFSSTLSTWQAPEPFLAPLSHDVSADAPAGFVEGVALPLEVQRFAGPPVRPSQPWVSPSEPGPPAGGAQSAPAVAQPIQTSTDDGAGSSRRAVTVERWSDDNPTPTDPGRPVLSPLASFEGIETPGTPDGPPTTAGLLGSLDGPTVSRSVEQPTPRDPTTAIDETTPRRSEPSAEHPIPPGVQRFATPGDTETSEPRRLGLGAPLTGGQAMPIQRFVLVERQAERPAAIGPGFAPPTSTGPAAPSPQTRSAVQRSAEIPMSPGRPRTAPADTSTPGEPGTVVSRLSEGFFEFTPPAPPATPSTSDGPALHAAGPPPAPLAPPAPPPVLQRAADDLPPPPAPAEIAPPPAAPGAIQPGAGGLDLDALANRLYGRISSKLRAELRLDRERAGLVTDLNP